MARVVRGSTRVVHRSATGRPRPGETLALASRQGHVRVFADESEPMHALVSRFVVAQRSGADHGVPLPYLGRLVRAFQPRDRTAAGAAGR